MLARCTFVRCRFETHFPVISSPPPRHLADELFTRGELNGPCMLKDKVLVLLWLYIWLGFTHIFVAPKTLAMPIASRPTGPHPVQQQDEESSCSKTESVD